MTHPISLEPFALPALPVFIATMAPLTPARRVLRIMTIVVTRLVRTGLPASCVWPSVHSVSNHPTVPMIALTRYPSASWASGSPRSGLHLECAGSPNGMAESSSHCITDWTFTSGCSPPRLAATQFPSVYRPESACLKRTHTSQTKTHLQSHAFPRGPWEREKRHADSRRGRRSVPDGIPTEDRGNECGGLRRLGQGRASNHRENSNRPFARPKFMQGYLEK